MADISLPSDFALQLIVLGSRSDTWQSADADEVLCKVDISLDSNDILWVNEISCVRLSFKLAAIE